MKSPKKNRMDEGERRGVDPSAAGLPHIDVEGLVDFEGDRAVAVEISGRLHPVSAEGLVVLGERRWVLRRLDGRNVLVEA